MNKKEAINQLEIELKKRMEMVENGQAMQDSLETIELIKRKIRAIEKYF